jgi:hypothetical protein
MFWYYICSVYNFSCGGYVHFPICMFLLNEPGKLSQYSVWLRTGWPGFDPGQGQRIFLLASASRLALGPTQPPIHWVPVVKCSWGMTLTTHPHLVLKSRMSRSYTSSPPSTSMVCSRTALLCFYINHVGPTNGFGIERSALKVVGWI